VLVRLRGCARVCVRVCVCLGACCVCVCVCMLRLRVRSPLQPVSDHLSMLAARDADDKIMHDRSRRARVGQVRPEAVVGRAADKNGRGSDHSRRSGGEGVLAVVADAHHRPTTTTTTTTTTVGSADDTRMAQAYIPPSFRYVAPLCLRLGCLCMHACMRTHGCTDARTNAG
jgi:hypothetical protein